MGLRKDTYKMVGKIEEQIKTRKGFFGGLAEAATSAVQAGKEAVQTVRDKVEEKGGLGKIVNDATDTLADKVQRYGGHAERVLDATAERANQMYDALESKVKDDIFKDGKFDSEKARVALKDKAAVAKKYGVKAAEVLVAMGKKGAQMVADDYRAHIPSQDERKGVYAGIGTAYDGFLFRKNYDDCLKFADKLDAKLPKDFMYRKNVIADAKASASQDVTELVMFYTAQNSAASKRKLSALSPVLKKLK